MQDGKAKQMPDVIDVVDPYFGERLEEVAQLGPIWVVATPGNENVCRRLWKAHPHADHREKGAITCFRVRGAEDRIANLLDTLPQIELHHGEFRDDHFSYLLSPWFCSRSDWLDSD